VSKEQQLTPSNRPLLALLIGDHSEGKTSTCRHLADQVRTMGLSVGGIIQPANFRAGTCIGYDVLDLATGRSARLADVGVGGKEHIGRFRFIAKGLVFGKAAIRRAARRHPQLIIVDEVGPLELAGRGWSEELDELVESRVEGQSACPQDEGTVIGPEGRRAGARGGLMLWSVRRSLVAGISARWAAIREGTAPGHYDLSDGPDTIIGDIILSLQD
jgi:nucleoside-triphosphatase THEP1